MRVAVLVSGSGTNLQALLDAQLAGALAPAEIVVVASNVPGVRALERAGAAGVPAVVVPHREFATRTAFEDALHALLEAHTVEAVVLAGFMRVLTAAFVDRYAGRIINTHPSLLPAFPGTHAARQALAYGAAITGCTVHFVDATLDGGAVIAQRAVPIEPDDDEARLQARIQLAEHALLPSVVNALATGRLSCQGRRVTWRP